MRRQRNMFQMKGKNKTPEKETKWRQTKFKTLFIRMHKEARGRVDKLRENFNSIKRT